MNLTLSVNTETKDKVAAYFKELGYANLSSGLRAIAEGKIVMVSHDYWRLAQSREEAISNSLKIYQQASELVERVSELELKVYSLQKQMQQQQ